MKISELNKLQLGSILYFNKDDLYKDFGFIRHGKEYTNIPTGNAISLQGCYSIRKVVKKSELEMGCVRTDAYSQELIKLMMKYDEQLQGIF